METIEADTLDRQDMERLAAGHPAALNDLMDRHATRVFRFLHRMLRNQDDAQDLAQEAFVRVYRNCQRYDPRQAFSTWLYTIAANLARNQLRWRARHPDVSFNQEPDGAAIGLGEALASRDPNPEQETLAVERAEAVRAAVAALPSDLREAIVLCEWEDRSVADAAAIVKTTPKAVESRLYRARQFLRERLRGWL